MKILKYIRSDPFIILVLFIPLAIMGDILDWNPIWVFLLSAIGIIPLAHYIGTSTEVLASNAGPRVGGLLNATLGNAAELIITIVAIREGLLDLVLASITGSILGNILLVLGMSMLLGGIRNGVQNFNRRHASRNAILLLLAVVILLIPSLFSASIGDQGDTKVEVLSLGAAVIMIVIYLLGILFSFSDQKSSFLRSFTNKNTEGKESNDKSIHTSEKIPETATKAESSHTTWSIRTALIVLGVATGAVVYLSEVLVGVVEPVVLSLGVSEFFLGIILIPLIGNVAEHLVAVKVAIQNQMDLSVEIAVASSLQIALFVAPLLVFISLLMGNPLQLIFNKFELLALVAGVVIVLFISEDGESNWLEGAQLLAIYLVLALAFFLLHP